LKALFRTVAMMVPDYAMIAEIMLYSYGYSDARPLSKKLVGSLQLASEQLSSQYHYDFGMRNVKSILVAAGQLKREFLETDEKILIYRAINDCNLSKFTSEDIPLFKGITKDLFPTVELPNPDYQVLTDALSLKCKEFNFSCTEILQTRCIQIYETMRVRHGFMVVGDAYAAKSTAIKVLTSALTYLAEENEPNHVPVHSYYINPKAQPLSQLYGAFDEATHEWSNGVLTVTIRECAAATNTDRRWIVFDGPVDATWIENMNTVLDDNKKLCLASGEIVKLTPHMSIIFEVDDLSVASPATISRVGIVYLEPKQLGWKPLVRRWLNSLPESMDNYHDLIIDLFHWLVEPCAEYIRLHMKSVVPMVIPGYATSLLRMLSSLLGPFRENFKPSGAIPSLLESLFVYSLIWAIGANTTTEGRNKFDKYLRELTKGELVENEKYSGKKISYSNTRKGFDL